MENYYSKKESVQEYIKMAKDVNSKQLIDRFASFLPANSSVLELGSGPGTDWKLLDEIYKVVGSGISEEFLEYLRTNIVKGEFIALDATTIKTDRKFDGIYSNKVLHHLTADELSASVERQSAVLNKDAIVCHSFWKGSGDEVFKGLFVNYHNSDDLERFFGACFETLDIASYKEFDDDDSLVYIGKKK